MNSEAAQQALELARRHYNSDNLDSALRFIKKSVSLHPTTEAKALLQKIESAQANAARTSATSSATSQGTTRPTSRKPTASTSAASSSSSSSSSSTSTQAEAPKARDYTPAQIALVKKVKACKVTEYYAILGLDKACSDSDIKKAYRKLALGLHPDKCGAPGTEEAFKMVSKAFQVLSDGNKRAIFDQTGSDPDSRGGGGGGGGGGGMHPFARGGGMGGGAEEMSPEDLFRFFFSGGGGGGGAPFGSQFGGGGFQFFGPGGIRMQTGGGMPRRGGGAGGQGAQREQGSIWIQIAPLLLLFGFSLLSQLPSLFGSSTPADPEFTFEPTTRYSVERTTSNMHINYYVNPIQFASHPIYETYLSTNPSLGFKSSHETGTTAYKADLTRFLASEEKLTDQVQRLRIPKSLATFERTVEQTYVARLQHTCRQELQHRNERLDRARGFLGFGADWDKVREITNENLPRCEELSKLGYRVDYR
ncbi:BZ3500_MvSof-1268-A1-R1_Chr9g10779 [Microbotryum saponariae]|uniref:BZ3500_MvSof-1268-A1-R1_Chr9g10779 protein n=1 Tax=Microbotryum saponariae TaxID=289078 RepID=A0A2X0LW21_9BASI|nr:BZ3501_MvSof-1269-A2-R1_Chr9g10527 [Microbotryum saponariae]SDA00675.1 BZ3500_MvSof-1268-A1-R1_Chr9g10779 [Microbotryum saponariae]